MKTPSPETPKLRDTGRLFHSIGFFSTPSMSDEERTHFVEIFAQRSFGPQLKIFNPDGLRVFSSRRPERPFPGNAPGPKGAA